MTFSFFIFTWRVNRHQGININAPATLNQYPTYMGKNANLSLYWMYKNVDFVYGYFNCQHKALLILGNPGLFYKYRRLAPYASPWVSRENIIPNNKQVTSTTLINYLSRHQAWCVIDASTMSRREYSSKTLFLKKLRAYVNQNASRSIYLGYEYTQAKNWRIYSKG